MGAIHGAASSKSNRRAAERNADGSSGIHGTVPAMSAGRKIFGVANSCHVAEIRHLISAARSDDKRRPQNPLYGGGGDHCVNALVGKG